MQVKVVYLGVALMSLCIVLLSRRRRRRSAANQPPGPWQLPVLGSLHHLAGQLPHHAMRSLARRHGPLMLLRLGEVPTLVVSSLEGAREVMKTHDLAFAERPLNATLRVLAGGGRDIAFAPYGDYWRQLRKIAALELFSVRRVLSFRAIREEEVTSMLLDVTKKAAVARPVELRARISVLVADVTVRAVMGDRFKERDMYDMYLRSIDDGVKLATGFNPPDLWPSSRLVAFLSGSGRRVKECRDAGTDIVDAIIRERLDRTMEGQKEQNLLDVLLNMQKEGRIDMDAVKYIIFDIFGAGSETTSTTLEWAITELMKNPMVMQKVTTEVLGYDVPQGMKVIVNAWALGRDERYWPAPDKFWPERFEGKVDAMDYRDTDFSFLPFGAGRRTCPGISFGLAIIELVLASLLFHFDWEGPPPDEFDMTEESGLTVLRKAVLLLRPVLRVPVPRI